MGDTENNDAEYVHEPNGLYEPTVTRESEPEFGRRGWVLVGMLFVAFIVVPGTILYLPQAHPLISSLGLGYTDAYLVLPLVPAFILGAIAVWVAISDPD